MMDQDESSNPTQHDHPFVRDQEPATPGRQHAVLTSELTSRVAELHALTDLLLAWQQEGLAPSGSQARWAQSFRHHVDENLTRATNVAVALRRDWSVATVEGEQSVPPIVARLCFAIWYLAGILSGAIGWGAGDALPPHPERFPRFWATPLAVRQAIHEGFDSERARLADGSGAR